MELYPIELRLRTTFRIAHGASDTRNNVLVRLGSGWGEAAPVAYHGESQALVLEWLRAQGPLIDDPSAITDLEALHMALERLEGGRAARAAIDIALHDDLAKRLGVSVASLLGCEGLPLPPTSFTLPIDTPAALEAQAQAATNYPILKIKLGGPQDLEAIATVRRVLPEARLRVDANAGWTRDEARERIPQLLELGVELIEQPLPVSDLEGHGWLRAQGYGVPIIADEPIKSAADVERWAPYVDGVNIKLMKTGGLWGAMAAIERARAAGLQVMLGCMIETSVGVAAAAAMAGLCDWADLDGPLLIANDPARGLDFVGASIKRGAGPGLGISLDSAELGPPEVF